MLNKILSTTRSAKTRVPCTLIGIFPAPHRIKNLVSRDNDTREIPAKYNMSKNDKNINSDLFWT